LIAFSATVSKLSNNSTEFKILSHRHYSCLRKKFFRIYIDLLNDYKLTIVNIESEKRQKRNQVYTNNKIQQSIHKHI
jgi:hypothetical protein